jgi:hypothetical protein
VTKSTQYVNIKSTDLKVDANVKITGEVRADKKTYALTVSSVDTAEPASSADSTIVPSDTKTPTKPTDTPSKTDTKATP